MKPQGEIAITSAEGRDHDRVGVLVRGAGLDPAGLEDHWRTVLVARSGRDVVGCAGLELYGTDGLLRSVAVAAELRGLGLGLRLTEAAIALARDRGLRAVYLLTETAEGFFPRFGFRTITRAEVPDAVKRSIEFTTMCPASAPVMVLALV